MATEPGEYPETSQPTPDISPPPDGIEPTPSQDAGEPAVPPPTDGVVPKPDSPLPPEISTGPERRVSPEDAEQAEAKNRQIWIETMDSLEASTETQGRYFAKVGVKEGVDNRTLILIEPYLEDPPQNSGGIFSRSRKSKPNRTYVVITRDGPMRIVFDNEDQTDELTQDEFARGLREVAENPRTNEDSRHFGLGYLNERGHRKLTFRAGGLDVADLDVIADQTVIKDVIKRSIDSCESPYKTRLEVANQSTQLAGDIKNMVGSLPPRT